MLPSRGKLLSSFQLFSGSTLALAAVVVLLSSALVSCGGGASSSPSPTPPPSGSNGITVTVSPNVSAVTISQSQSFTATLSGGSATLSWFVDGVEGGNSSAGTIASSGATTATYSASASTTHGNHAITAQPAGGTPSPAVTIAVTDLPGVLTHHNDNARTGQNTKEYLLTPSTVSQATFGKLFSCPLDAPGYVYAAPLYVANLSMNDGKKHNVVFIATESDWVYAYDADSSSCQQLWKKSMLGAGETTVPPADTGTSTDLTPEIGITSTPVIDLQAGIIYVCAKSKSAGGYAHRLHALNLASGADAVAAADITAPNFVPLFHLQRPALLLSGGVVYVAFGSHGDQNTYQGWLMGYDAATLTQKFAWSSTDPTSDHQGAIWQSGGGPSADAAGNIYVETANGNFNVDSGGIDYSDSVVKLTANGSVLDYFTPSDESALNSGDVDLGSSAVILLPDSLGSAAHPNLLVATGKPGKLYLLDQANLGKFNSILDQALQEVAVQSSAMAGVFGQPAYWNGNLYTVAIADYLKQFTISSGSISTTPLSHSANIFNRRGGAPVVSANNATNGIVWVLDISGYPSSPAVLNAYDATNVASRLYSSPTSGSGAAGLAIKFASPTVANGKVYVGSQGQFDVFGLLAN
ncbi:MAG: hypothetical protein ACRD3H_18735 [Terriglobales bacterium]